MAIACTSLPPSIGQSTAFEDFRCLNSYPLYHVGSGNLVGGDLAEKGYFVNVN